MAITVPPVATSSNRLVARGSRFTNATGSTSSTEQRVLGLAAVSVQAGRLYRITAGGYMLSPSTTNTFAQSYIRHTTDGTVPTTSSTQLASSVVSLPTANGPYTPPPIIGFYYASADGTIRPMLSYAGGAGTVTLMASGINVAFLTVEDLGPDVGSTGTNY